MSITDLVLHSRLKQDTCMLGHFETSILLLMKNASYPWFVLVPDTDKAEIYQLDQALQSKLLEQVNLISRFLTDRYSVDKLNIGAIGNLVPQLHIHIVGRYRDDPDWPGVVWGTSAHSEYQPEQIDTLKKQLHDDLTGLFTVEPD